MIVVSTLVNVDDLNQTSAFGRIVSDQIASVFNNAGYRIMGMEMPTAVFVKEEGCICPMKPEKFWKNTTHPRWWSAFLPLAGAPLMFH